MKKIILGIVIGMILCGGIVYGANLYKAEEISYEKDGWEVNNVNEALDDLYNGGNNKSIPVIKNIDYVYFTHVDWNAGRRTETLTLTIEPNGAKTITLNLNEEKPTGAYSTPGSATITNVTNGTFSGATITPENSNSDVVVTVSVTYSGDNFTRHLGIESYT